MTGIDERNGETAVLDVVSPLTRSGFRLLVVDDEYVVREDARDQVSGHPDISLVTAATQDAALEAIQQHYFDAAIIDIELDVPAGGHEVLREFADVAPGTPLVIATKHVDPTHVRDLIRFIDPGPPRIVKIVDKAPLDKPGHRDASWMLNAIGGIVDDWRTREVDLINDELALRLLRARADRIPKLREDPEEIATEVDRICRRLFGDISGLADGAETGVVLRPIGSPGLSSAITVEAVVTLGEDLAGEPVTGSRCVLKIGPVESIREEVDRYERFVRYGVRLTQRVELLDHTYHHALGAVCYSFAGGVFGDALTSLQELLDSPDDSSLAQSAIAQLFATSSQNWYAVQCDRVSARTYMSRTYSTDFGECYKALEGTLGKLARRLRKPELQQAVGGFVDFEKPDDGSDGAFEIGGRKLVVPRKNVLGDGRLISAIPACLVHGDMHGGNVMLELADGLGAGGDAELRRVCLIDYRSAGPGPRAVDAVALQASLRLADTRAIVRQVVQGADPERLDDMQLAEAVRIAAARTAEEAAVLRRMWDPSERESLSVDARGWLAVDSQIIAATLQNFADLTQDEYLAIAVPYVLQQIGYKIGTVARVRMLAWLSAQYEMLLMTS